MSVIQEIREAFGDQIKGSAVTVVNEHGIPAQAVVTTLSDGRTVTGIFTVEDKAGFGGVEFTQRKDVAALMISKISSVLRGTADAN